MLKVEPNTGLDLMSLRSRAEPEPRVGRSTDCVPQAPPHLGFKLSLHALFQQPQQTSTPPFLPQPETPEHRPQLFPSVPLPTLSKGGEGGFPWY